MALYRFEVEERRYATLWIEGDNVDDALADAEVLADELGQGDWADHEVDIDIFGPETPTKRVTVWSGGPDGHDYVFEPEVAP